MDTKSLLLDYLGYNLWANQQFVNWFKETSPEILEKNTISSFNSIKSTILHIWDAEYIWFQRLNNKTLDEIPSQHFKGDVLELFDNWLRFSEKILTFVKKFSINQFSDTQSYNHNNKTESTHLAYMILTCMNHGSYHRGQLVTMARNLGLNNPPKTDFIQYYRQCLKNE